MSTQLQYQGISENMKYVFTNKGIVPTVDFFKNDKKINIIEYSYENLNIAVDILKEHKEIYYKLDMISLVEYSNSSRKFLYELVEIFKPENSVSLIKEWEEQFGSKLLLINESVDKLIVESRINESWESIKTLLEAWYDPTSWDWKGGVERAGKWVKDQAKGVADWTKDQAKQIKQKGVMSWAGDKVSSVWNSVKNAVSKAWKCLSNNFVECLMEGIRTAAFSAVGMGVMTAVTFIPGVGQIADFIVFGALLIWDVYKMFSGKYESGEYQWSFADIIVDAVCLLLPALGAGLKVALKGVRGVGEMAVLAAKEGKGGIVSKAISLLKGGLSKILSYIGRASEWIGEKLGLTWLKNMGTKAQSFMSKTVQELENKSVKAGETIVGKKPSLLQKAGTKVSNAKQGVKQFSKDLKFLKPTPVVVKSTGKTIMITATLCAALGLDGWSCHHKIENGEISPEQLAKAEEAIKSEKFTQQLNQMSVQDAESIGLF